jgi:hypothetical protein
LGTVLAFPVSGASGLLLDRVDIGNTASEAGHVLQGWGPVEPTTHPGGWGGISTETPSGTLRVLWYSDLNGNWDSGCHEDGEPNAAAVSGKWAQVTLFKWARTAAKTITIRHLDGTADDSFEVWVQNPADEQWVPVGSYTADVDTDENWVTSSFSLDDKVAQGGPDRSYKVQIRATAAAPWTWWCWWGQVGIDWIELRGDGKP